MHQFKYVLLLICVNLIMCLLNYVIFNMYQFNYIFNNVLFLVYYSNACNLIFDLKNIIYKLLKS